MRAFSNALNASKTSSNHQAILTEGNLNRHLWQMSWPMVVGIMAIITVYLVDSFFIAQLGSENLAAIGFAMPVINFLTAMAFGIGSGTSAKLAIAVGSGRILQVKSLIISGLFLALGSAIIFAIIGFFISYPFFDLIIDNKTSLKYLIDYLEIWYLGCFLVVVPMVANSAMRALGDTKTPSLIMLSVALTNLILDPILIFGLLGLPKMGIKGAALATIIAYGFSFSLTIYILLKKHQIWQNFKQCLSLQKKSILQILSIALPATLNNLVAPLSVSITTILIANYGTFSVAAYGVASRLEAFLLINYMALASVMGPIIGQNYAAKKFAMFKLAINNSFIFSTI